MDPCARCSPPRHPRTDRCGWSHEVKWDGVRVLADTTRSGRPAAQPQRERRSPSPGPSSTAARWATATCWSTARSSRSTTAGSPTSGCSRTGCTCATPRPPPGSRDRLPATLHGLRRAARSTADLTGQPLAERREILRGLGLEHSTVAGPRRRTTTARCCSTRPSQQGLEGIVSKRLDLALRLRRAHPELAEVRAPAPPLVRRGRLAPAGGHHRPAGRAARRRADRGRAGLPRPGRQRHRRRGRPGAARRWSPRIARADSPFADEVPDASTRAARTGWSRCWWSTSRRTAPATHAAPPAVVPRASAPTSDPEDLRETPLLASARRPARCVGRRPVRRAERRRAGRHAPATVRWTA